MDLIRKNDAVPGKWKQGERKARRIVIARKTYISWLFAVHHNKKRDRKIKFISCWSQICKRSFHRGVAQVFVHRHNRSLRRHTLAPTSFHRSLNTVLMHQCDVWSNNDTRCSDDRTSFRLDNVCEVWYRPVSHVPRECSNRSCREHPCSEWNKPMASSSGHCWTLWNLEKANVLSIRMEQQTPQANNKLTRLWYFEKMRPRVRRHARIFPADASASLPFRDETVDIWLARCYTTPERKSLPIVLFALKLVKISRFDVAFFDDLIVDVLMERLIFFGVDAFKIFSRLSCCCFFSR